MLFFRYKKGIELIKCSVSNVKIVFKNLKYSVVINGVKCGI